MQKMLHVFALSLLAFSAAAQAQQNPLVGTWKQNPAKSKYTSAQPVKSNIYTIVASGTNGITVKQDRVNANDSKDHIEFTANIDEKDYPVTGYNDGRALVSIRKITANSYRLTYKTQQGEAIDIHPWVVSPDGKTLSSAVSNVNANGQLASRLTVFDKQ